MSLHTYPDPATADTLRRTAQAIHELGAITASVDLTPAERLSALLRLGGQHFALSTGMLSRIQGGRFRVLATHDRWGSVAPGDEFPLTDVYCSVTVGAPGPVAFEQASATEWARHRCHRTTGVEAYLGVAVRVDGEPYGTLCFLDPSARRAPFSQEDRDLLLLLAQAAAAELERQAWKERMQAREERFRVLVESASDLIYSLDRTGRITYANPAAQAALGYDAGELARLDVGSLVHPRARVQVERAYRAQARARTPSTYLEFPVLTRDGREIWLGQNVQLLLEAERVVGTQAVARDITERRKVDRLKEEFVSVVSHELRTPLTSVRGALALLASGRMGQFSDGGQRMLQIAAQNTDRLVRLINDILDLEKIESGKMELATSAVSAARLVEEAADEIREAAQDAGVRLEVEASEVVVEAHRDRILQVLSNLLGNAVKYSPAGEVVRVRTHGAGGEVCFEVEDRGPGIPVDRLERIFERFEQVDSSDARRAGGTGLGLAMARSIVRQHGGRIWAESRPGGGSRFLFTLPAATRPWPTRVVEPPLVLVCDDDRAVCRYLQLILERQGYRVRSAHSGEEIIQLAAEQQPSVVLLDFQLAGINGRDTLALLREWEETREIPVIMLSGQRPETTGIDLREIIGWIEKPVDADRLFQMLARALERTPLHADVLLVEDDDALAQVLVESLAARGLASHHARTGEEAIRMGRTLPYNLVVLDVGLPDRDGFEVVATLRTQDRLRHVPLLVFTADHLSESQRSQLRLGPTEYLVKSQQPVRHLSERAAALLGRGG